DLHDDLISSLEVINEEYIKYNKVIQNSKFKIQNSTNNGLVEYYGPKNPKIILVAMGSVVGTIKEATDEHNSSFLNSKVGILKIKTFRPFPAEEIIKTIKPAKYIAVIDKSISLGYIGPLAADLKAAAQGKVKSKIQSFIVGLGGRDITKEIIKKIISEVKKNGDGVKFVGK
ncbi:MAG: pyruvate ferredoxin oxidoreductase, partial [Patescibacteria group bacterium]